MLLTLVVKLIKNIKIFSGKSVNFLLKGVITCSFASCHLQGDIVLRKLGQKALVIRFRKPPPIYKNIATHSLSRNTFCSPPPFFHLPFTFDPRRLPRRSRGIPPKRSNRHLKTSKIRRRIRSRSRSQIHAARASRGERVRWINNPRL